MSIEVTAQGGLLKIKCGDEYVLVTGAVVYSHLEEDRPVPVTPIVAPGTTGEPPPHRSRPDLPPAAPPGVSVSVVVPAINRSQFHKVYEPALEQLLVADAFKGFARQIHRPCVVTLAPSELETFQAARMPKSVSGEFGRLPMFHTYLALK
jgi:hypothetical protein